MESNHEVNTGERFSKATTPTDNNVLEKSFTDLNYLKLYGGDTYYSVESVAIKITADKFETILALDESGVIVAMVDGSIKFSRGDDDSVNHS